MNKTKVSNGRGRPRSIESENAILDATLELLAKLGFRAVTTDKIAAKAGASKTTIYRRWPTKENLVIAAFSRTPDLAMPGEGDIVKRLTDIIWQFSRFMQETTLGGVLPALVAERAHNPSLDEALTPLLKQRRQPIIDVIQAGIDAGELPASTNAEFAADMFMGPVTLRVMIMNLPTDRRYIKSVVEKVRDALQDNGRQAK